MQITIEHHDKSFNVALSSSSGKEPFLTIKGCRIVDSSKGRFVSMPAKKLESGKYWNHCYASDGFQDAIIQAYDASAPKQQPRRQAAQDDDAPPF